MIWLLLLLCVLAVLTMALTWKKPVPQMIRWTAGVQGAALLVYLVWPPVSYWLGGGSWQSLLTWYDGDGVLALAAAGIAAVAAALVVVGGVKLWERRER